MPRLELHTPEGITLTREIAGAGSRFAAGLFDGLLILAGYLALFFVGALIASFDPSGASALVLGMLAGGIVLVCALYTLAFHVLWDGQTPGKRLLGLRVASADGYPATAMQNVLRSALWPADALLPVPVPFGWLGLVLIAVTEKRQRLGDLVAGTLVLRESREGEPSDGRALARQGSASAKALPPGIAARLTGEDFDFLRELLGRTGLKPGEKDRLLRDAALYYSERLELPPAGEPRAFLEGLHDAVRESRAARA